LIVAMLSIGTLFGSLIGATCVVPSPPPPRPSQLEYSFLRTLCRLADRLGRKKAIVVDNMVLCVGIVIQCASFTAWVRPRAPLTPPLSVKIGRHPADVHLPRRNSTSS